MTPSAKFERKFCRPKSGRTLIVGSHVYKGREDRRLLYPDVVGLDMVAGLGVDWAIDLEEPLPAGIGLFNHVECRSVLEHSRRPWLLAGNVERLMVPGATLDIAAPFVWRLHQYPGDFWRFTVEGVRLLFPGIEWLALRYVTERRIERPGTATQGTIQDGQTFFARSEVLGFGRLRC